MRKKLKNLTIGLSIVLFLSIGIYSTNAGSKFSAPQNENFDYINHYNKIEKSSKGISEYKRSIQSKNMILKKEKVKDIVSTVTFNEPISHKQLKELITNSNIKNIKTIQARIVDSNGERITGALSYTEDEKDIQSRIDMVLAKIQGGKFLGFTDAFVTMDFTSLDYLESNPLIFLNDTSADSYFTKTKDSKYPQSLTWLLEDVKSGKIK